MKFEQLVTDADTMNVLDMCCVCTRKYAYLQLSFEMTILDPGNPMNQDTMDEINKFTNGDDNAKSFLEVKSYFTVRMLMKMRDRAKVLQGVFMFEWDVKNQTILFEICYIQIAEDYRRKGIGSTLIGMLNVQACRIMASESLCVGYTVTATVEASNDVVRFFNNRGFVMKEVIKKAKVGEKTVWRFNQKYPTSFTNHNGTIVNFTLPARSSSGSM